ncbi:hypothetical protein [Rhizobium sp. PL01]|uniref:hypothetical protein n=1 Tax=Rhizobium sp. PL01 TaxID=3085631 RepID=UPI002980EC6F|nr:hypothetical protein [Rhizobium sp. PL01]MDW5318215.1 hypothetical protein [Rhizobium sp. PL01]
MKVLAIPLLPCQSLGDVLPFYEALGFEVTMRQQRPNPYAATRWRETDLHFFGRTPYDTANAYGMCLFIVPEVEQLHAHFSQAIRALLGKVPATGLPRITRIKPGQARFTVVDPAGNSIIYVRRGEKDPHEETKQLQGQLSPLGKALRAAEVLSDYKNDDVAAAKVLRTAISKHGDADPQEVALAISRLVNLESSDLNDQ